MLLISALQTKLIFPGAVTQGQRASLVPTMPGTELARLDTSQGQVAILFGEPLARARADGSFDNAHTPTVLFFYGNGMCMADAIGIFHDLRRLGNNVVLVDYPGYGMSGGTPSETGVYAAAGAAYDFAVVRRGVARDRIVAMGWSLGAAAAIEIASRKPVEGLILCSAFTSMSDMARRTLPMFPTGLLLKHRFENATKLAKVKCPILIVHGEHDSIIPSTMSDHLAAIAGTRLRGNLRLDSDHNDLFDVGGDALIGQVDAFIQSVVQTTPH
jgi:pimeloyl-ACP methyl ester carboxylesterase